MILKFECVVLCSELFFLRKFLLFKNGYYRPAFLSIEYIVLGSKNYTKTQRQTETKNKKVPKNLRHFPEDAEKNARKGIYDLLSNVA